MRNITTALALAISTIITLPVAAQQKRPLDHDAYAVWNQIEDEALSADGAWLAYRLVPGEGDATLIVRGLRDDRTLEVERGGAPRFTADSRFLIALIEPAEAAVEAAREEDDEEAAPPDSLVVVDLSDVSTFRAAAVASFGVPEDDARWMAYLSAPEPADEDEEDGAEEEAEAQPGDTARSAPRLDDGTTLVVRDPRSGAERRFEHVVSYVFAADGSVLYYTASGVEGAADGVYRVGPEGAAAAVASGPGRYVQLSVSDDGNAAFLTDRDDRGSPAPAFSLYVATGAQAEARVLPGDPALPAGWAPSEHGQVSFSASGRRVFFGSTRVPAPEPEEDEPDDEAVVVDVWNWKDPYLQPMQLLQAEEERERTYQAMLDLRSGRTMQLATEDVPSVGVAAEGDGNVALGRSDLPYRQLVSWDGRYSDLYVLHLGDGRREQIAEMVRGSASLSPGGRYVTWWDGVDKRWYALEAATGRAIDLTGALAVPFHDVLDDHPDALGSYGSAGWTEDEEAFVVYDQFDIWAIDPTGQVAARNLTEGLGRRTDTRFRYLELDEEEGQVPTDQDVYLSAFHLYTKQDGVYRDRFGGSGEPERLLVADARFDDILKAEDADVVVFSRATFQEFPDLWVADGDLDGARRVTDANPQQDEYSWGSAELVEWSSNDGTPLQGILYKPEGFDASRPYPMMVYFYERLSEGLHQYVVPEAGSSSINRSFYVSRGYLLFVPDIPYRIGYPGESALDAVVPGVLHLVDRGFVDRDHIGVQGHSWGGYQIAYMVTRTDLFAAAEAGAPVANMVSAYGGIRWGSGMSRMFQYERTQSRIGGSLWDRPLRYIENSPIFTADKIRTPILMMHNDEDTAVPWEQGIELFVALRRLGQPVWMLNYNGEPHGLTKEQNRKDWAVRMQQFFDHYLKDAPPPVWMEEGVPAMLKGKTLGLELASEAVSEGGVSGR
jgi:dipeptidyl aminopeptidase/acylaminoacyl peptidase